MNLKDDEWAKKKRGDIRSSLFSRLHGYVAKAPGSESRETRLAGDGSGCNPSNLLRTTLVVVGSRAYTCTV